jgi:glycosyltransferase involved in cell wall biosynthesis
MQLTRSMRHAPILVQDHGGLPPRGWRRRAWRSAFRPIAAAAFTAREQVAPWIESRVLCFKIRVFDVLEGSSTFGPGDRAAARAATGMFGDPCLLWTGRLDENKDPLMMLDAVERAAVDRPDLRLWCCFGKAPMLGAVEHRISASPVLRDRVVLLGTRPSDAMEAYYRGADFYVQTSHREVSGFSLLEALSCGTPPLVTDIPAARRIVGDAGALTPVGDAAALASAIVEWSARDQSLLRAAARARFEDALTFDAIARQLRGAYEMLALA